MTASRITVTSTIAPDAVRHEVRLSPAAIAALSVGDYVMVQDAADERLARVMAISKTRCTAVLSFAISEIVISTADDIRAELNADRIGLYLAERNGEDTTTWWAHINELLDAYGALGRLHARHEKAPA